MSRTITKETAHAIRIRARNRVARDVEADAKALGETAAMMAAAAKFGVWPTTVKRWIADENLPTLPQARRILELTK